jgi:hypothetical protein
MKICITNAADHTDGTGGTIGPIGCNAGGKRTFGKRCGLFRVPRYDPMAFHDLHGGPAGIRVADCTGRARFACPFVSRSHVMQVFLANFASAPRWVFTRRCFCVGCLADWAGGARDLTLDVLKKAGFALRAKAGLLCIAMKARIASEADRTTTSIRGGCAECTSRAMFGIQLFRCPTLWTLWTFSRINVAHKGTRFAWGSVAFDTSLDRCLSGEALVTGHGPIFIV